MKEYMEFLKTKYNYDPEMLDFLNKLIPALVTYYGEDNKNTILSALANTEIHIQKEHEQTKEYLNNYFETDEKWDIPLLGCAFYHNQIDVRDGKVSAKPIVYIITTHYHNYVPFDFSNEKNVSTMVHEICHLVKGYGKLKVIDGKIVDSTGLSHDSFDYDDTTKKIKQNNSNNVGLEEAINSYDEAQIMSLITKNNNNLGSYPGMANIISELFKDKTLAEEVKKSQFNDDLNWINYFGRENANILTSELEKWINCLYTSPSELLKPGGKDRVIGLMNDAKAKLNKLIDTYGNSNEEGLFNSEEMPLSSDPKLRSVQEKIIKGEELSFSDKIVAGRDHPITEIGNFHFKPDHVYRAISKELFELYKTTGFIYGVGDEDEYLEFEENGQKYNNNKGVDWYLGGAEPRYGKIIIECPADKRYFQPAFDNGNRLSFNPNVRFMKSSGKKNPVPFSMITSVIDLNIQKDHITTPEELEEFIKARDLENQKRAIVREKQLEILEKKSDDINYGGPSL